MKKKTILIEASLTGGRGPAKQAYEFVLSCKERDIPYILLTNTSFIRKLTDLGLNPDIVLNVELSYDNKTIYQTFYGALKKIDFDFLVKFGARTASTYTAYKLGKPFVVVDGGLPDKIEDYPSLYAKEGYLNAENYILTTHFPWKFPNRVQMKNVIVGTYPFSQQTINKMINMRTYNRTEGISKIKTVVPEVAIKNYDLLINLLITGDFLVNPYDRKTYGGWLTASQYDETVGFMRRFITDLALQYKGKALVFLDRDLIPIVDDIVNKFPNIILCYNRQNWSYDVEIAMQRLADIVVSRATNYIPYLALMGQGGLITTPVPAHGYMDEDTAGLQASALGLTELIEYNDEQYMKKFLHFIKNKLKQKKISQNLIETSDKMLVNGLNAVDLILKEYKKV